MLIGQRGPVAAAAPALTLYDDIGPLTEIEVADYLNRKYIAQEVHKSFEEINAVAHALFLIALGSGRPRSEAIADALLSATGPAGGSDA